MKIDDSNREYVKRGAFESATDWVKFKYLSPSATGDRYSVAMWESKDKLADALTLKFYYDATKSAGKNILMMNGVQYKTKDGAVKTTPLASFTGTYYEEYNGLILTCPTASDAPIYIYGGEGVSEIPSEIVTASSKMVFALKSDAPFLAGTYWKDMEAKKPEIRYL